MRKQLRKAMINWREIPFFRLLIPLVLGILTSLKFNCSAPWINYFLFILLGVIILTQFIRINFKWNWLHGFLINAFLFCFALQLSHYHTDWHRVDHFRNYLNQENLIIGVVDSKPSFKSRTIQIDLALQQIGSGEKELNNCTGSIFLSLRNDTINQSIRYGDLILLRARPRQVKANPNPETFDFSKYLANRNIHYQAFANGEDWTRLAEGYGNPVLTIAFKIQDHLSAILEKYIPQENELAVATALILGNKEKLSSELRSAYAETGAMHVLAVSGLHVGLIWGILSFLFSFIRWRHSAWSLIRTLLTLAGLWSFALVTGASPSVLRAATMFSFLIIGSALQRNPNVYNTLAASAFCLLLFNPMLIVEVGFQLSYLAVIGIVYFYRKIYGSWYIENYLGDQIWKLSAVAIAAQLSTLPLTMFYFHQFPIYFLLSGLIVVPFAFLILSLGIVLFIAELIIPFLSYWIAKLLFGILWLMNAMINLIQQLPDGFFKAIWIEEWGMILLFVVLFNIVLSINTRQFKWLMFAGGFLLVFLILESGTAIKNRNQKLITFYHIPKYTYIEFVDANHAFAIDDQAIDKKLINYNTTNFHLKHDIKSIDNFHLVDDPILRANWMFETPFVQFFDYRLAILKTLPAKAPKQKIKLDAILFRRDAAVSIVEAKAFFDFDQVIIDGALNYRQRQKLWNECQRLNISYHDTSEGALMLKLK